MDYSIEQKIEALRKAVAESFENLIFREVEEVEQIPELPDFNENDFIVNIKAIEPFKEELHLIFNKSIANVIVSEMAGEPEGEFPEDVIKDALGEITNTTIGRWLAALVGEDQTYELDLPICDRFTESECKYQDQVLVYFKIEDLDLYGII